MNRSGAVLLGTYAIFHALQDATTINVQRFHFDAIRLESKIYIFEILKKKSKRLGGGVIKLHPAGPFAAN